MKFRVRYRPKNATDWPELIGVFDLQTRSVISKDKGLQAKEDLAAAASYLKKEIGAFWDIISIEKLD